MSFENMAKVRCLGVIPVNQSCVDEVRGRLDTRNSAAISTIIFYIPIL
jgi:hypothetical protein